MSRKRRNKRQEDEEAEVTRLMEEAAGETDTQRRDALGMSLLLKAAQWAEKRKPTPRDAVQHEYQLAADREDWTTAESACHRLLELSDSPMGATHEWERLADVLSQQGRHAEAFAAAQSATAAARGSNLTPLVINALRGEAAHAEKVGERAHAYDCLEEGIAVTTADEGNMYVWQHARFLVQRAAMKLDDGQSDAAAVDLKTAEPVLQPYASSMMMAGPLAALRNWWHVSARLHLRQGNSEGAQRANQEALWIARRIAEIPQLAEGDRRRRLVRSLDQFAEVQEQAGFISEAEATRQEATDLRTATFRNAPEG